MPQQPKLLPSSGHGGVRKPSLKDIGKASFEKNGDMLQSGLRLEPHLIDNLDQKETDSAANMF